MMLASLTTPSTKMSKGMNLTEKCTPYADMPMANHGRKSNCGESRNLGLIILQSHKRADLELCQVRFLKSQVSAIYLQLQPELEKKEWEKELFSKSQFLNSRTGRKHSWFLILRNWHSSKTNIYQGSPSELGNRNHVLEALVEGRLLQILLIFLRLFFQLCQIPVKISSDLDPVRPGNL